MRVLLVDDDQNFRRSLRIALETHDCDIAEASEGLEAIKTLEKEDFNAVILDARMPGLDGFWLADQIRLEKPEIRIIMLSAHNYPNGHSEHTMLTKPVKIKTLLHKLKNGHGKENTAA